MRWDRGSGWALSWHAVHMATVLAAWLKKSLSGHKMATLLLSALMISKTHKVSQKPHGRQKCAVAKMVFMLFFVTTILFKLKNSSSLWWKQQDTWGQTLCMWLYARTYLN